MSLPKSFIIGLILIFLSPVVAIILWVGYAIGHGLILKGLGYDVDTDPKTLAELIVQEGGSVERCRNLKQAVPTMGPTIDDKRMRCVYEYASITKDPLACEGLMPSDYGWSCLGAAEEPNQRWCWFDFGPMPPIVGQGDISVSIPECRNDPANMRQSRCCELAETLYVNEEGSCDRFTDGPQRLHDQCQELLAKREKDIEQCSSIVSNNVRTSCEVAVRALLKEEKL